MIKWFGPLKFDLTEKEDNLNWKGNANFYQKKEREMLTKRNMATIIIPFRGIPYL